MVLFPNSKINIGLNILRKRADGFHDLESLFYPLPLQDALEALPAKQFSFHSMGIGIPGEKGSNLCEKAYQLLRKDFPHLPTVQMELLKSIPIGAGLGGGSADGAFTLKLLNNLFNLKLTEQQFLDYALMLGSDCPFFIRNEPSIATGRGDHLESIALDLSAYRLVLVHPGIHINTGWAFGQINPAEGRPLLRELVSKPIETWKLSIRNDFEKPVCEAHPVLQKIKDELYGNGALYASMTGSGSSFYGIFKAGQTINISSGQEYRVNILN